MEPPLIFRSTEFFELFPILSIAFVTVWAVNCNFLSPENIVFSAYRTVAEHFLDHFNRSSRWWFNNFYIFYIFLNLVLAFDLRLFKTVKYDVVVLTQFSISWVRKTFFFIDSRKTYWLLHAANFFLSDSFTLA